MYTFYSSTGTCARSFQTLLEDIGVPYEVKFISLKNGDQRTPEYLKMNPRGQVPLLSTKDFALAEGSAIASYLFEKYPGKTSLIPTDYPARAKAYEGIAYMNSTVHPMYSTAFSASRYYTDATVQTAVQKSAIERLTKYYAEMEQYYSKNQFYAGTDISLADVMFTTMAGWNNGAGLTDFTFGPNCQRVINAVNEFPAYKAVLAQEEQANAKVAFAA